jgi:hypothetical protein
MYAVMTINHNPGASLPNLPAAVNAIHDPVLLKRSQYPGASDLPYDAQGLFAGQTLNWQVICFATDRQLQVIVESRGGNLRDACRDVWKLLRSTIKPLDPRLGELKMIDVGSPEPVATATTGLKPQLARSETQIALYPGVVTFLLVIGLGLSRLVTGHRFGDLVIGGAPAVLVTLVALALAAKAAYSRMLIWQT